MGKMQNDDMLNAALNYLKNYVDKIIVCSQQPTTYAEAITTYALADVDVDSADFTLADGDTSGRKVTIAEQADVPIDATGTGNHIALCSVADTTLRYVTTCADAALTMGGTVTFPAWEIELADPA